MRLLIYIIKYITTTLAEPSNSLKSIFFIVRRRIKLKTDAITKNSAIAESNRNKLQYFLPKGPNSEFIIHRQKKRIYQDSIDP